jgi:hypothetical protein
MNTENFKKPKERRYSVSDHLELHKTLLLICNKYSYLIHDPDMINIYGNKLEQEHFGYNWVRRSQSIEKKMQINRRRKELLNGIRSIVRVNLKNFDPEFSSLARACSACSPYRIQTTNEMSKKIKIHNQISLAGATLAARDGTQTTNEMSKKNTKYTIKKARHWLQALQVTPAGPAGS